MLRSTCIEQNVEPTMLIKKGPCVYGGCMLQVSKSDGLLKIYDCGAVGDVSNSCLVDIVGIDVSLEGADRMKGGMEFGEEESCIRITNGIVAAITGGGTLGVVAFK